MKEAFLMAKLVDIVAIILLETRAEPSRRSYILEDELSSPQSPLLSNASSLDIQEMKEKKLKGTYPLYCRINLARNPLCTHAIFF